MKSIAPGLALLFAFCGAAATSAMALELAGAPRDGSPAVLALLETAEQRLNAGRPEEAAVLLERALRIEPRNRTVWHYLGHARFEQGAYAQAEAMAAKSHNLDPADRSLRMRNVELMAAAQQAAGKPVAVPSNEPPISTLQRLFATAVEPARSYLESAEQPEQLEQSVEARPRRPWAWGGAAEQTLRTPRPSGWRRPDGGYTERVERDRAAGRKQNRSRSIVVFDGRRFRRYESNETARRLQL